MIIQRVVQVQVLLLSLILLTQSSLAASKNKSSKSYSSKAKSSSSSTSNVPRHTSAHQYGPGEKVLFLKPSKPDPHFEITAEQRGIYFPTKIREGRGSSLEQKASTPEKQRNAPAITFPSQTQSKRSSKKGKAKSSSSRAIPSTNLSTERRIEHEQTKPRFSGSQLLSGDVGMLAHKPQGSSVEKNGWKILMGPSVAPDESIQETSSNEHRTFTSFTDGAQRTIVDLKKLRGKSKSSSISSYESFARNIKSVNHNSRIGSNFGPTRRSMQVAIPKQKLKHNYAKITKRVPSKSNSGRESTRYGKKVQMSFSNAKLPRHSASSKDQSQYFRPSSTESGLNVMSDSPVMTLDTKKLVIEPTFSSAEPTSMMSTTENFSTEHDDDPTSPTMSSVNSRYDRLPFTHRDIITSDDNDFHTKTAFGAADFPLLSVSATMNNPSENINYNDNHHDDQAGDSDLAGTNSHVEFLPFPDINHHQSHEIQEPQIQNGLIEDDNITPPPPPPEFLAATGNVFPSEHLGVGRFPPNHNGKLNQFSPFHRVPIPVPYFADPNFHLKALPSEDPINLATPSGHPPIPSSSRHPPLQLENSPPPPPPHHFHGPPGHHGLVHHGPRHHGPGHLGPGHHGPGHHGPLASIHHHPLPPPPPPLPHLSMEGGRPPPPLLNPLDIGSGRHIPGQGPPPPPGVDPDHPAVQHALRHPYTVLKEPSSLEPPDSSAVAESNKNYLHYSVHKNALIPLDKRLVYLAMIFSWMFWISAFYSYYRWNAKGNKSKQILLNVPKNGETPEVSTRALDLGSQWNFTKVLEYIEIAQKTYEGFDWQDLNCQKRTLCELVQKQNEPWGETGRKMANSYVYRVMDALDGVPIPRVIQTYLKEYKEAISQGKNSSKDCGQVYSGCKFSIKDVLAKSAEKKKKA